MFKNKIRIYTFFFPVSFGVGFLVVCVGCVGCVGCEVVDSSLYLVLGLPIFFLNCVGCDVVGFLHVLLLWPFCQQFVQILVTPDALILLYPHLSTSVTCFLLLTLGLPGILLTIGGSGLVYGALAHILLPFKGLILPM